MGGYIARIDNISEDGDCWVYNNAKISSMHFRMRNNVKIRDNINITYGSLSGNIELKGDSDYFNINNKFGILRYGTIYYKNMIMYRIQAVKDFGDVKAGDLGGYITNLNNINIVGNSWVYDDAKLKRL